MMARSVTLRPSVVPGGQRLLTATIRAAPGGLVMVEMPIGLIAASAVVTGAEARALGTALMLAAEEAMKESGARI